MKIDKTLLDDLTQQAKASPRLRMNFDLRTSAEDCSQRMLNAMEPGTQVPIHRHTKSTETVIVVRGKVRQIFYRMEADAQGQLAPVLEESFVCEAGGEIPGFSVEVGRWHKAESLVSGTVIMESKDGKFEPLGPEDIWKN